jgi:hypothetical protein
VAWDNLRAMPSATTPVGGVSESRSPQTLSVTLSRDHLLLTLIVVSQSLWLGFVMMRGWYSSADLPNLAYANGRDLDWDYLTSTLGGHFGVAQRLVYWLLNRAAPLEWWLTVLIRLVCQAVATVLLWRLMRTLSGRRTWVWIVLVGYAFSPYLAPGMAALNSGLGLGIAQACLIGALLSHVNYARNRRLLDAATVAVLVLVMLAFAQQSLPMLVFLPALSFVFLPEGSWTARLRAGLSLWPGWLMLVGALGVFATLYLVGDYNSPSSEFTPSYGFWLAGQAWLSILGPALAGGPWQFYTYPNQWSAYADAPTALVVVGQVLLVGLMAFAVRRRGFVALIALMLPVCTTVATLVLVGTGRSWLGDVLPSILRYSYFVPVSLALGIVLAFGSLPRSTSPSGARVVPRLKDGRRERVLVGLGIAALLGSSMYSTARFADRFWDNPADEYVAAALGDAATRGPSVQIYDTVLPESVVPYISEMYVSDLMALGGRSADYEGPSRDRLVVDSDGRLVPARFVEVTDIVGPRRDGCGIFVRGEGTTRVTLGWVKRVHDWFLQLELYQPRANQVAMKVLDQDGDELEVVGGSPTLRMSDSLVVLHRRLEAGRPAVIELTSTDPATNFCLVHAYVGVPVP